MASLVLSVPVAAPAAETWAGAVDWESQGRWMLATTVRVTSQDGLGVGAGVEAFTGIGRLGVRDVMQVSAWDPPYRCDVLHVGRVVRGSGTFEVVDRGPGGSLFRWREDLDLPLGLLGRLGWPLVKPFFALGVLVSLRRFARWVEAGRPAR